MKDISVYFKKLQVRLCLTPQIWFGSRFKTKKSKTKGFNSSITVGGGFGKYGKANESINMNYRNGKVNLFGNYSYSYNRNYHTLKLLRNFRDSATQQINSVFDQRSVMNNEFHSHNFKVGMDYYATKNTTLGVSFTGNFNPGPFKPHTPLNYGIIDTTTTCT